MNTAAGHGVAFKSYGQVSGRTFPSDSVIAELYRASISSTNGHFEGQLCAKGLLALVAELRRGSGETRVHDDVHIRRATAAIEFARAVLQALNEVDAVVIYGSVLRGKLTPGDLDVRLVTRLLVTEQIDVEHPVMSALEGRVDQAFKQSATIPKSVEGLVPHAMVNSAFNGITGMDLSYVTGGPYLAVMRGKTAESVAIFLNTSVSTYLSNKTT